MTSPCLDCARRELGCHAHCQLYSEFNKKNEEVRHQRRIERDVAGVRGTSYEKYVKRERKAPINLIRRK